MSQLTYVICHRVMYDGFHLPHPQRHCYLPLRQLKPSFISAINPSGALAILLCTSFGVLFTVEASSSIDSFLLLLFQSRMRAFCAIVTSYISLLSLANPVAGFVPSSNSILTRRRLGLTKTSPFEQSLSSPFRATEARRFTRLTSTEDAQEEEPLNELSWRKRAALLLSQKRSLDSLGDSFNYVYTPSQARALQIYTFSRIAIPSILSGMVATLAFPALSLGLCTLLNDAGVFTVLSTDSSQFVQNFLTVAGLLFSILVGQTYCT